MNEEDFYTVIGQLELDSTQEATLRDINGNWSEEENITFDEDEFEMVIMQLELLPYQDAILESIALKWDDEGELV